MPAQSILAIGDPWRSRDWFSTDTQSIRIQWGPPAQTTYLNQYLASQQAWTNNWVQACTDTMFKMEIRWDSNAAISPWAGQEQVRGQIEIVQEDLRSIGEQHRRIAEEHIRKLALASEKASALLKSLLSSEQWAEYMAHGRFTIVSQSGERYRIDGRNGRAGNIVQLHRVDGNPVYLLCCHPAIDVPIEDVLIAQKLHLECNEVEFRRLANLRAV